MKPRTRTIFFKYELLNFFDRDDINCSCSAERDEEGIWRQYAAAFTGLIADVSDVRDKYTKAARNNQLI